MWAKKKFLLNDDVIAAVNLYFAAFDKGYFSDGMKKLETCWTKYIALNRDYVEKCYDIFPKKHI